MQFSVFFYIQKAQDYVIYSLYVVFHIKQNTLYWFCR